MGCLTADCSKIKSSPHGRAWTSKLHSPFLCSEETCHKPSWKCTLLMPRTPTDAEVENLQWRLKWGDILWLAHDRSSICAGQILLWCSQNTGRETAPGLTFLNGTSCHLASAVPQRDTERICSADGHSRGEVSSSCRYRRYQRHCSLLRCSLEQTEGYECADANGEV